MQLWIRYENGNNQSLDPDVISMNLMVLGAAILPFSLLPSFEQGLTNTGKNLLPQKKFFLVSVDLTLKVQSSSGKQRGSHKCKSYNCLRNQGRKRARVGRQQTS